MNVILPIISSGRSFVVGVDAVSDLYDTIFAFVIILHFHTHLHNILLQGQIKTTTANMNSIPIKNVNSYIRVRTRQNVVAQVNLF